MHQKPHPSKTEELQVVAKGVIYSILNEDLQATEICPNDATEHLRTQNLLVTSAAVFQPVASCLETYSYVMLLKTWNFLQSEESRCVVLLCNIHYCANNLDAEFR